VKRLHDEGNQEVSHQWNALELPLGKPIRDMPGIK
jgi:hypothetical protein